MKKLIVEQKGQGHAIAETADPWDSFVIHRIDREFLANAPDNAGIYILYGADDKGKAAVYVGKSTTSLRSRLKNHKSSDEKAWFGTIYAVPLPDAGLCSAVEAELISSIEEAAVVPARKNKSPESRFLESTDIHVFEIVEKSKAGIELLLGSPIFSGQVETDKSGAKTISGNASAKTLSRQNKGQAKSPRPRTADDHSDATHAWIGAGIQAWGRFLGKEPETKFLVTKKSAWRSPNLDPSQTTFELQAKVQSEQDHLMSEGVLDESTMTFTQDHVFENWTRAARIVSGKAQYSGGYHWQKLS